MTEFRDFGLAEPIVRAIAEAGYTTPTPIQAQAIPVVLGGRDLVGIAQTGTGKTASFALPILHHLATNRRRAAPKSCRVLVLSPTRELSSQILDSFRTYGRHLGISSDLVIGGVSQGRQVKALAPGLDVLVATPGRLMDLNRCGALRLDSVEVFVLDEADRMLDMGFIRDIRTIIAKLPVKRQTLLFSATMPADIAALADQMLKSPATVAVTPVATTVEKVEQRVIFAEKWPSRRCCRRCSRPMRSSARWCLPAPSTAPTGWSAASASPASRQRRSTATSRRTSASASCRPSATVMCEP
jgi:ATP-dependent RNA helicase RhlE